MRWLVIGGTSFFGKHLVERLLARGDQVSIFSRGERRPAFWDRIEHIRGDRTNRRAFVQALRNRAFDVVVDNIAFEREDVLAAGDALRGRVGHYILTSTGSVYIGREGPPPTLRPLLEDDADITAHTGDSHGDGKRACEQFLRTRHPYPFTIIRPPIVQGPEDPSRRGWFWYERIRDGGPVLVPQRQPSVIWRQAYSGDVVQAFLRAAGNTSSFGKTYNVAMDEVVSLEDFVRLSASILERPDPVVAVPQDLLRREAPWYRPTFSHRFVLDTTKIKHDLGFVCTPLRQWLEDTIRWHLTSDLGPSDGYTRRADEIALAERQKKA